jgi:hypothetical protein
MDYAAGITAEFLPVDHRLIPANVIVLEITKK